MTNPTKTTESSDIESTGLPSWAMTLIASINAGLTVAAVSAAEADADKWLVILLCSLASATGIIVGKTHPGMGTRAKK